MSDFEHELRPEVVPGVTDIETLGVSPYLLETLQPEDARTLLLAMAKTIQTVAHPDRANTNWSGPDISQVTYSAQVIKTLSSDDLSRALSTYVDNAAAIRQAAFETLRSAKVGSDELNQQLGRVMLEVVTGSKNMYAHTNGLVFSTSLWAAPDMTETMYKLRIADGVVRQVNRLEREGVLIERLPAAIQEPLRNIDEELRVLGDDSRTVVVASDGRLYTAPEKYNRHNLVPTDIVVPFDESYPLASGSYIHFRDAKAKTSTKTKLGAHIFSDSGIVDDSNVQKLIGARYIGIFASGAAHHVATNKMLSSIIEAQDHTDYELFRQGVLSEGDLAALIANGLVAVTRQSAANFDGKMVYSLTKKSKNIAFLPNELLTIN